MRKTRFLPRCWRVSVLSISLLLSATASQRHKHDEPKSQVAPLPPQPPMALKVERGNLDFHLSPLLKAGGLAAQIRRSLNDLIRDTKGEKIVKLRAFVAGAGDARRVQAGVAEMFTEHKLPLPVLTVVQVGGLGEEAAKVVIEAIVSTRHVTNPDGLAFFAGQDGSNLTAAVAHLKSSAEAAKVEMSQMLTTTCFTSRIDDMERTRAAIRATFPNALVNLVQAVRDPLSEASTCSGVGQLSAMPGQSPVLLLKAQRTALVNAKELVITGLQLSFGSYLDDAHEAFVRLRKSAAALNPAEAPIEANVFSLDPSGGSALRKTASVPPSILTVQAIEGLPSVDATAGLEAILASDVAAPAVE